MKDDNLYYLDNEFIKNKLLIQLDNFLKNKRDKNNIQYECNIIEKQEWQVYNKEIRKVLNDTRTLLKSRRAWAYETFRNWKQCQDCEE